MLVRWASAAQQSGDFAGAAEALERAASTFRQRDDVEGRALALERLSVVRHYLGDPRQRQIAQEAVALLEATPGPALVEAIDRLAGGHLVQGENRESVEAADRAIELAAELGLPEPARAVGFRGAARCNLGDLGGMSDLERALELLLQQGRGRDAVIAAFNKVAVSLDVEGPAAAIAGFEEVSALAGSRGIEEVAIGTRGVRLGLLVDAGRLSEAMSEAAETLAVLEEMGHGIELPRAQSSLARAQVETGLSGNALALAERALESARATNNPVLYAGVAAVASLARGEAGEGGKARELLAEMAASSPQLHAAETMMALPLACRCAVQVGTVELAEKLCEGVEPQYPLHHAALGASRAQVSEARGELVSAASAYRDAAERWAALGAGLEQAYAVFGEGRCLAALVDPSAETTLREARRLFEEMGAAPRVAECDAAARAGEPAQLVAGSGSSPRAWITTAATTTAPPMSVAVLGCSVYASHTSSGPSTTSSRVMSATSGAGIRRAPITRKTRPRPICPKPSRAIRPRSCASTDPGEANGANATTTITCDRQMAGPMEMSRRCRVITRAPANDSVITSERPRPAPAPPPGPPIITPTPASATTIATPVLRDTDSRSTTQAIRAAAIGESACRKMTFATVAWLRATMKVAEAIAVNPATASSASPIERNGLTTWPPLETATKARSAIAANTALPATWVAESTESARCSTPAVDQATAAMAT